VYKRQIYQIAESNRNFFLPELECSSVCIVVGHSSGGGVRVSGHLRGQ